MQDALILSRICSDHACLVSLCILLPYRFGCFAERQLPYVVSSLLSIQPVVLAAIPSR